MLWYFPHPAVCWDFLANFAKDEKYLCVRSGKAETTYTEQQKIFSWFQVYSQLSCSIAEMSQILRRCYAINWSRDEKQNSRKIFVWCQTPSDILGCSGLHKLWAKTRNYGHWQNSERIRDFFFNFCGHKNTTAWQSWLVEGQYPKRNQNLKCLKCTGSFKSSWHIHSK